MDITSVIYAEAVNVAAETNPPFFTCKTVFPFDFFPNTINIYRDKVAVVERSFFLSSNITSIPIQNIDCVKVHNAFPFASLEITDRYSPLQPIMIRYLRGGVAQKAMEVIDGLRFALRQNLDVTQISREELERMGAVSLS